MKAKWGTTEKAAFAVALIGVIVELVIAAGMIYVGIHFVKKAW